MFEALDSVTSGTLRLYASCLSAVFVFVTFKLGFQCGHDLIDSAAATFNLILHSHLPAEDEPAQVDHDDAWAAWPRGISLNAY